MTRRDDPLIAVSEAPLGDLLDALIDYRGKTPPKAQSGVVLVTAKVIKGGRIDRSRLEYIAEGTYDKWMSRGMPRKGDILVTTEAPLGEVAQLRTDERVALAQRVILLRPDAARVDPQFLFHFLRSPEALARVRERSSGTTVLGIRQPELRAVMVPLLGPRQQRVSAVLLDAFDEVIEINERRIELLEGLARSLYRQWFVRFRFPDCEDVDFVNSELGAIPVGWCVKPSSVVFRVNPRFATEQAGYVKLTMADVDERFSYSLPSRTTRHPVGSRYVLNDVLLARITPCLENGKTTLVKFLGPQEVGVGSTEFIVLRGVKVGPAFVYCAARSDPVRSHVIKSMSGSSGRQRVATSSLDSLLLVEPSETFAARFEAAAGPMLDEVFALHVHNRALAQARDVLLPRLVNGRLDVSDLDLGGLLPADGS